MIKDTHVIELTAEQVVDVLMEYYKPLVPFNVYWNTHTASFTFQIIQGKPKITGVTLRYQLTEEGQRELDEKGIAY